MVNRGLRCLDLLIGWGNFFGGFFWKAERWSWGLSSIFSPCGSLSLSCGWTARFCSCRLLVSWWLRLFDWLVPWLLEFISASLPFLGWSWSFNYWTAYPMLPSALLASLSGHLVPWFGCFATPITSPSCVVTYPSSCNPSAMLQAPLSLHWTWPSQLR